MEEMSFWDHLEALRWCIFRVIIVLVLVLVGCFIALPHVFDSWILGPAHADFFVYRWFSFMYGSGTDVELININVASQFLTHVTTSIWISLVIVFPYLMYQTWVFVKPALYPGEIKGVRSAFSGGTFLFYLGCAVGYLIVFPVTFKFLTQYQVSQEITNQISLNSYMSIFLTMIFLMGITFELPVLLWLLSKLGIVTKTFLRKSRKYAVVILLTLAALITPTGDPFTLMVVFAPLYLLYEFSIFIVKDVEAEV